MVKNVIMDSTAAGEPLQLTNCANAKKISYQMAVLCIEISATLKLNEYKDKLKHHWYGASKALGRFHAPSNIILCGRFVGVEKIVETFKRIKYSRVSYSILFYIPY